MCPICNFIININQYSLILLFFSLPSFVIQSLAERVTSLKSFFHSGQPTGGAYMLQVSGLIRTPTQAQAPAQLSLSSIIFAWREP